MANDNLNEKQSIKIIENMINTAKQEHTADGGFYFVLWGAVVMVFCLLTYLAIQTNATWQPWTYVVFLVGGVASFLHNRKSEREEKSKSWYDSLYSFVWMGTGLCIGLTWGFVGALGLNNIIPVSLMFYGLASFITGGVSKYYPSLIGSIICFMCAVMAFFVSFASQNLVCAFAILCTHVIPGLMMRKYYKRKLYAE